MRIGRYVSIALMLLVCDAAGQEPAKFEAASIKLLPPAGTMRITDVAPFRIYPSGRLQGRESLESLIRLAYGVESHQPVVNPPNLSRQLKERYEVAAVAARPDREYVLAAARQMLSERFHLKTAWDTVEQRVLVLARVPGKPLGQGLERLEEECTRRCAPWMINDKLHGMVVDMKEFAKVLSNLSRRAVYDETGLVGPFEITLTFSPHTFIPPPRFILESGGQFDPPPSDAPAFSDGIRDQLGLMVQTLPRQVRTLVIESIGPFVED